MWSVASFYGDCGAVDQSCAVGQPGASESRCGEVAAAVRDCYLLKPVHLVLYSPQCSQTMVDDGNVTSPFGGWMILDKARSLIAIHGQALFIVIDQVPFIEPWGALMPLSMYMVERAMAVLYA